MTIDQAAVITDGIFSLYEQHGGQEYAGEKITQLEHMIQSAQLAEREGYPEEVILSAFLHDIGHICVSAGEVGEDGEIGEMDGFGIMDHEAIGADFLAGKGFAKKVVRLVESHVEAKRYLTFKDPAYYGQLSEASKKTLEYQGGPMTAEEAGAFEQYPLFDLIIKMRRWDELAKETGLPMPDLLPYRQMMTRHLASQPDKKPAVKK